MAVEQAEVHRPEPGPPMELSRGARQRMARMHPASDCRFSRWTNKNRLGAWAFFALVLLLAPLLSRGGLAISMLSQMGYAIIICLSFNILLGQGGMLSFGHAVYSGLGAFAAAHAMNLAAAHHAWYLPLPLVPLVGGVSALCVSVVLGFASTRRSGSAFAMITLGIGELLAAMSLVFPGFFGGEGGVGTNRVYGARWPFGISFGPPVQAYYLIAFYCFACTASMFAFTHTPLGRMLNAVRDNPERVEFLGYSSRRVRYQAFMVSAFFAGIGGALAAIHFEIVSAAGNLSAARSGSYLLFTVLGGTGFFLGPVIGGVLLVLASMLLSAYTPAWLLYLGLGFMLVVTLAPGGVASIVAMNLRLARHGLLRPLWPAYAAVVATGLAALAGASACIEMVYHLQLASALGPRLRWAGLLLDTSAPMHWAAVVAVLVAGAAAFFMAHRHFARHWEQAQKALELATHGSGQAPPP